jgi:hypothetical protein
MAIPGMSSMAIFVVTKVMPIYKACEISKRSGLAANP